MSGTSSHDSTATAASGRGPADRPAARRIPVLAVAFLAFVLTVASVSVAPDRAVAAEPPPETGFEQRDGASWTTHAEETAFLREVNARSQRVEVDRIGTTPEGRPLRLVQVGDPAPQSARRAARDQVALVTCSQHGNEPAGRETCLKWLRDLAFTTDPALVKLLRSWTFLFVPNANPDGRAANTRENAEGTDINRDHLNLTSVETQAVARVIRDWRPDLALDLHEIPADHPAANRVLFDDDVYYLWPRNLNVDPQLHSLSKTLAVDYIGKGSERAGYSADEYGKFAVADQDVHQFAGDHDEGILRNLAGLRAAVSVLIESNATANPQRPEEMVDDAARNRRRVASQYQNVFDTLRFLRTHGNLVAAASDGARDRYTEQGRDRSEPVYFGGADNDPPEPDEIQDPPPCAYWLTREQAGSVATTLGLLDINARRNGVGVLVPLAQPSEPLIPLLLDRRGQRHAVEGVPIMEC